MTDPPRGAPEFCALRCGAQIANRVISIDEPRLYRERAQTYHTVDKIRKQNFKRNSLSSAEVSAAGTLLKIRRVASGRSAGWRFFNSSEANSFFGNSQIADPRHASGRNWKIAPVPSTGRRAGRA